MTDKDKMDGKTLLKELVEVKKFANIYQSKLYDKKILKMLAEPYSCEKLAYLENLEYKLLDLLDRFDFSLEPNFSSDLEDVPEKIAVYLIGHQASNIATWYSNIWKKRQNIEIAKTIIAIKAFYTEHNQWPKNLEILEIWFGEPIGKDLFSKKNCFGIMRIEY